MNQKEINEFRSEMKYYAWLKDNVQRLENKADEMLYELENVKAIRYDKAPMSSNQEAIEQSRLASLERYNKVLDNLKVYKSRLEWLDKILEQMGIYERRMFLLKYEDGLSFQEVANRFYISKAGLFYRMQKVLERIEL